MPAKKAPAKKTAKPKVAHKMVTGKAKVPAKKAVGVVTHYFDKISVAVIEVKAPIKVGDTISFEGPQTNLKQKVTSMQVEHKVLQTAKKGDDIGLKTTKPVRAKDVVYLA